MDNGRKFRYPFSFGDAMKRLTFVITAVLSIVIVSHAQPYSIQQYLNIRSASAPSFSPDGKRIAYLTNASGTTQVWEIDLPGGTPRQLTNYEDNIAFVRWLPDDSGIIFGKAKGGGPAPALGCAPWPNAKWSTQIAGGLTTPAPGS